MGTPGSQVRHTNHTLNKIIMDPILLTKVTSLRMHLSTYDMMHVLSSGKNIYHAKTYN